MSYSERSFPLCTCRTEGQEIPRRAWWQQPPSPLLGVVRDARAWSSRQSGQHPQPLHHEASSERIPCPSKGQAGTTNRSPSPAQRAHLMAPRAACSTKSKGHGVMCPLPRATGSRAVGTELSCWVHLLLVPPPTPQAGRCHAASCPALQAHEHRMGAAASVAEQPCTQQTPSPCCLPNLAFLSLPAHRCGSCPLLEAAAVL